MSYQFLTVEHRENTAVVCFDRGSGRNALSQAIMLELTAVAQSFYDDRETKTVILTGTDKVFSAGVDLKDPARWEIDPEDIEGIRLASLRGAKMCKAWEEIPQITIAAIEGVIVGGGIALTLVCDWRVISEKSVLKLPEAQIGIPLSWQTVPRLVNIVGASRAKQLILLGEDMTATDALALGIMDFGAPEGQTLTTARALAEKVNRNSRLVNVLTKSSINNYANALNHLATAMDVDQAVLAGLSGEARQARRAFATPRSA